MADVVHVIGAGLAGSEAAYQLAQAGVRVVLHEMRPARMTAAHQTGDFAELVCSNTFKSRSSESAPGMLKWELSSLGSSILQMGEKHSVPGGEALAVDRVRFSEEVSSILRTHPNIEVRNEEVLKPLDGEITLIATGPLTSEPLAKWIGDATNSSDLYFYDAIAPIVDAASLDMTKIFAANRYNKGEEVAYLNCPMDAAQYQKFISELLAAGQVPAKNFEKEKFFQGCQPIEAIAASGPETLRFGPMKPVGLTDPSTGRYPHAVVQLRPENQSRTAYNLVGFQTRLKHGEQKRIFGLIPGLENAEFLRLGSIHRNTFVCGPRVLRSDLSLKKHPKVYLAGQITGVEGYLESTACGLLASRFILERIRGTRHLPPPPNTALGALLRHVVSSDPDHYQPSSIHFGLFEQHFFAGVVGLKKDLAKAQMSEQAKKASVRWSGVHFG